MGKETTQDETSERTDENAPFVSSDDAEDIDAPEASLEEVLAGETPDESEAVSEFMTSEDDAAPVAEVEEVEEIAEMELFPARVKWFDKAKGFGFANVFADGRDVFLHVEVLRRSGMADLATGEAVGLRWMEGDRGLMAVEITPWELASK